MIPRDVSKLNIFNMRYLVQWCDNQGDYLSLEPLTVEQILRLYHAVGDHGFEDFYVMRRDAPEAAARLWDEIVSPPPPPPNEEEIRGPADAPRWGLVNAVVAYRNRTGVGLKDAIETLRPHFPVTNMKPPSLLTKFEADPATPLIDAVRSYRNRTGVTIAQAKQRVEYLRHTANDQSSIDPASDP